ncbi:MAG TPA: 6-phosphogluconolactonase [Tepidisphaeraceae bacterium]|nr:6-phosphogluconolactonase [Tepidisphaeraceae bacterium]
MKTPEIKVLPTADALAREAATRFVAIGEAAIETRGKFTVALSGGSTPRALHNALASDEFRGQLDWSKVEIFFGDERCVPPEDADSNYRMARETLLSKVPIPGDNIYRMRGEIDPEEAAKEYGQMLKEKFADGGLDLVLLGMGDDGHTASLFPHTTALHETKHRCVANHVEKLNAWRITLTAPFINRSKNVIILVSGVSKSARLSEVLESPRDPDRLPIQLIQPAGGQLTWLLDSAAAEMGE